MGILFLIFSIPEGALFPKHIHSLTLKKKKKSNSHVPIPDLARAFHMVKVLTVKSAMKQQQPDVFSLNLKADILYIAFIQDQSLSFLYILTRDVTVGSTP